MKMMEAEQEALRLCPDTTVFLSYERKHYDYSCIAQDRGFDIECAIWVASLHERFRGPNWEAATMQLRNALKVNPPQPCPDQEIQALPAA
jgi:hypothetical protein